MADTNLTVSLTIDLPSGSTKVLEFSVGDPIMVGSGPPPTCASRTMTCPPCTA